MLERVGIRCVGLVWEKPKHREEGILNESRDMFFCVRMCSITFCQIGLG